MEGARAAELAGDVQIKGGQAAQPLPQDQQQQLPTGSEAVEMPATPLPHAREIEWSEHFSFFNSMATATGTGEPASVGMSRSESSRPDSVTQQQQQQQQRCLEDERVEELTVRNCISSEAQQPAASAGGSTSSSGERPAVMRGLWGNFTRMAWRTADAASREALAVSRGDIANMRNGDLVGRENLAVSLGNGMGSQNIDASAKEMPFGRGENGNAEFNMSFGNQQQQHILSSRPNQSEQHILSSRPNQSEQHILSPRPNQSEQHILSSRPNQSEQHILPSRQNQSEQHVMSSWLNQSELHIPSSRPNQSEQHILPSRQNQSEQHVMSSWPNQSELHIPSSRPNHNGQHVLSSRPDQSEKHVLSSRPDQSEKHVLSSRPNQNEQHVLSSRPNQSEQHVLSSRPNQSEQHVLSSRPNQSEQHILSSRPNQSEQHILSSRPNQSEQHILSSRPNQNEQRSERENGPKVSSFSNRIIDQMRSKTLPPLSGVQGSPFKPVLKGKRVTYQGSHEEIQVQANARPRTPMDKIPKIPSSTHDSVARLDGTLFSSGGNVSESQYEGTSLRELIKPACQAMSKFEKMHLFKQILEHVDKSHAQGVTLQHLRPSYFIISSPNQVRYTGSYTKQDLSTPAKPDMAADDVFNRKRCFDQKTLHQECNGNGHSILKYRKVGEQGSVAVRRPIHPFWTDHKVGNQSDGADLGALGQKFGEPYYGGNASYGQRLPSYGNQESVLELRMLEDSWYRSPEELNQLKGTFPANIYSLGVLLFELFSCCETWELHCAAMSDLRHRILPPSFLSESPKEAGFCLWLLHPDPFSRPKARDILGCDLINEGRDLSLLDKAPAAISEEDTESGLLLNFLSQLKEEKETQAAKLSADLSSLQTDIVEAERRHSLRMGFSLEDMDVPASSNDVPGTSSNALRGASLSGLLPPSGRSDIYEERVMKNLQQLENAYYSTRSTIDTSETNVIKRSDNDALRVRENFNHSDDDAMAVPTDRLGCFFDGLCKYARHSRFEVRGILKNADILNSPNVICSLSFDRDEEYFAAAGVSKKIKIFEFDALLNDRVDIHYPIVEMPSKSKLSCVCWNNYIKNYLASTDYDGTVQLWDASTGQGFTQFTEHRKRAWSVSFSEVDPTKLASGSDDCCVKVWNINQKNSIDTIRNVANVCCVQFSPYSSRMLAFGSADYKTYCYDLRHTRIPWCTISGHGKAVSYVRFLDAETLISASTDNTLKIWDLNRTNPNGLSTNACSLTLSGHTNEKNFVGLSVHDGYITCGSENNEVYSYYKSFPMPITSHKFGSIDPITGQETNDDNQQFVSSVCWRGRSNMVVAANSSGSIKVLELV
ncbi:protein SUPPRESSOR OF PHYA-105 1-like [Hordeum vulgare subsp. vulgare]|uniref:Protein kinase domain-containing protein n=1 Tax=Hordeum vulgare subsp. vulgare TaxID=112509 RepID=A0A8I6WYB0_HORVV|nr:protein SUPPRESSOR OF PHYA-105 1-like [Hordeum vulgare subsp. vulgare]